MPIDSPYLLLFVGLLYILALGGLSLLRREGLSVRFAVESLLITAIVCGLAFFTSFKLHPVLFLILLYLVTMRGRLLVDLGNTFAMRGSFALADQIYHLAASLGPDPVTRASIALNQGVERVQQGRLDEAIAIFNGILVNMNQGSLGLKQEAACHYNLGIAYQRKGQSLEAEREYQSVLEILPVSEYACRASKELARQKQKPVEHL